MLWYANPQGENLCYLNDTLQCLHACGLHAVLANTQHEVSFHELAHLMWWLQYHSAGSYIYTFRVGPVVREHLCSYNSEVQ